MTMAQDTWRFRLVGRTALRFEAAEYPFDFMLGGRVIRLWCSGVRIDLLTECTFTAGGFPAREEATQFGERLRAAVLWSCAESKSSALFADGDARGWVNPELVPGMNSQIETEGLFVFADGSIDVFHALGVASVYVPTSVSFFTHGLEQHLNRRLHNNVARSIRFYSLARAVSDPISRFLLMIIALEALPVRATKTQVQRDQIEQLHSFAIGQNLELLIIEAIKKLDVRSVKSTCKSYIGDLLTIEDANEFADLYDIRSRIVHGHRDYQAGSYNKNFNAISERGVALAGKVLDAERLKA